MTTDTLGSKSGDFAQRGGFFTNIGDGITLGGYGLTMTGIGAKVGVPLAGIGNMISTGGAIISLSDAYLNGNFAEMNKIIGFQTVNIATGHLSSKVPGFNTLGKEIFKQNVGLKVILLEKWYDNSNNKK